MAAIATFVVARQYSIFKELRYRQASVRITSSLQRVMPTDI
jgi:hypothetical protein